MSLKDFKIMSKLGEGAYSTVYKVRRIEDNAEYALKKVNLTNLSDKEKQNALNEVRILASIKHPFIISYKEAFIDVNSNSLCIVMELADNGDLFQQIQKCIKSNTFMPENDIMKITFQIASGLKALHDLKIFHRDLKSANIFLQSNGDVKLGDMNVSKVAKKGLLYTQTGTPYYASPEVWKDQPYDQKSDIWSLGCVTYEMAALKPPFRAEDMEGLYKKVIKGLYPRLPSQYSQDLQNVIRMMLQVQTHLRPTSQALSELPYFNRFKTQTIEDQSKLLNTIIFPKNQISIANMLPKANYSNQKYKTEAHQNSDTQETINRNRQTTLGAGSQQSSPNPTRISQYLAEQELLLKQQYSINYSGKHKKAHNYSDRNVIAKILLEYQKEVPIYQQLKQRYRRLSQEETPYLQQRRISQLPVLIEHSPNQKRNNRNQSLPAQNLPII
ncbi:unnamed protein product (macronuclear) [Paramecium tetraurelia]|uniref:non-specific serine/threonine protein kinase n=1 Tax=Paramecium tetraurelia TaxID=5888 RepID=A0C6T4_PARTE|nr:uncharacterized protein GSPATT00035630001 [Paramecium tetraurelia]CAK66501.1 unnamed protein product [Paramecium tetraurelia]|eukprot:XP_001433898.1 hypothetical protein (macronuclear) [Paramecium tetraurelia strain d4-2]